MDRDLPRRPPEDWGASREGHPSSKRPYAAAFAFPEGTASVRERPPWSQPAPWPAAFAASATAAPPQPRPRLPPPVAALPAPTAARAPPLDLLRVLIAANPAALLQRNQAGLVPLHYALGCAAAGSAAQGEQQGPGAATTAASGASSDGASISISSVSSPKNLLVVVRK